MSKGHVSKNNYNLPSIAASMNLDDALNDMPTETLDDMIAKETGGWNAPVQVRRGNPLPPIPKPQTKPKKWDFDAEGWENV